MNFLRGLLTHKVALKWVFICMCWLFLVIPRSANCDSLMELGRSSTSEILISVSQEFHQMSKFLWLQIFRSVTSGPLGELGVYRTILISTFTDNFHDAFFGHRLVRNDGTDANCFSFVCIVVGDEECVISLFFFSFFCHQSSFCNRRLISCLIRMVDSVSLCASPSFVCTSHLIPFLCNESITWILWSWRNKYFTGTASDRTNVA